MTLFGCRRNYDLKGAMAEIVRIVSEQLSAKYNVSVSCYEDE
jgi:hypothetical protein